jgi:hypothetical protein
MRLCDYLDGMRAAQSAEDLEAAIQAPYKHGFSGRTWTQISRVRLEAGRRLCAVHPHGHFVPVLGPRRKLTVCNETYGVGCGQNSTGVRYVWHSAQKWAEGVLRDHGMSRRAAHAIWGTAFDYPHRALSVIDKALAGGMPDPVFDTLIRCEDSSCGPVRVNRAEESKHRAHRDCECGGVLWDWGCDWTGWADYLEWRCDSCSAVFGEYLSEGRLVTIRQNPVAIADGVRPSV